jgi:hypothetical protein
MLYGGTVAFCQAKIRDYEYWTTQLSKKGAPIDPGYTEIVDLLNLSPDSSATFEFLQQMENRNKFAGPYLKARLKVLSVYSKIKYHSFQSKSELILLSEAAP